MQWLDWITQAINPPLDYITQAVSPWNITRATGIIAYLLLSLSTLSGLWLSLRKLRGKPTVSLTFLHQPLGNWGLHLTLIHAFILLWDHYVGYSPAELLVPFYCGNNTIALGFGIIGMYVLAVTILNSELRAVIGYSAWKKLHMLSPITYLLATAHGLAMGSDTQSPLMISMYFGSIAGVIILLLLRLTRKEGQLNASANR